jgi:hypothetical protein
MMPSSIDHPIPDHTVSDAEVEKFWEELDELVEAVADGTEPTFSKEEAMDYIFREKIPNNWNFDSRAALTRKQ